MIKWLLRMFRKESPPPPSTPPAQKEAEQELLRARQELMRSEQEAAKAHHVAGRLSQINKENHFAERALTALRGIVQ